MQIEVRETVEAQILLTSHDLEYMRQFPLESVAHILATVDQVEQLPPPSGKKSSTRAFRQVDEAGLEPCPYPKCGYMFKPQGFGNHFKSHHPISYKEFLAREERRKKNGKSSRFPLLLPATTNTKGK